MKNLKISISLFFICTLLSCSDVQTNNTNEQDKLNYDSDYAKVELIEDLNSKENPVSRIVNSYTVSSSYGKEILQQDLELSYERMKIRLKLISNGEITIEDYFNDINGAQQNSVGFKTELGKKISEYYKRNYITKTQNTNIEKSSSFKKYLKVKELEKKL